MLQGRAARVIVVPLALVAMLLIVAAAGGLLHHHDQVSETHCQICHLVHQGIEQPLVAQLMQAPAPAGSQPAPEDSILVTVPIFHRAPTRAPPSA